MFRSRYFAGAGDGHHPWQRRQRLARWRHRRRRDVWRRRRRHIRRRRCARPGLRTDRRRHRHHLFVDQHRPSCQCRKACPDGHARGQRRRQRPQQLDHRQQRGKQPEWRHRGRSADRRRRQRHSTRSTMCATSSSKPPTRAPTLSIRASAMRWPPMSRSCSSVGHAYSGTGNATANVLVGNTGANLLDGGAGNDRLAAGNGNDILRGGVGQDIMTGGSGRDVFDFNAYQDTSTAGPRCHHRFPPRGGQDRPGGYRRQLRVGGNQAFSYIWDGRHFPGMPAS